MNSPANTPPKAGVCWQPAARPRRPPALNAVAGDVTVLALDVADRAAVAGLPALVGDGAIDILINNAGIYGRGQSLGRIDYAGWENVLRTNVLGPIGVTEALLPNLMRATRARIALM